MCRKKIDLILGDVINNLKFAWREKIKKKTKKPSRKLVIRPTLNHPLQEIKKSKVSLYELTCS